jgi:hypothetical protein
MESEEIREVVKDRQRERKETRERVNERGKQEILKKKN